MALNEAEQATIVENSGQWVLDYIAEIEQQLAQARKQAVDTADVARAVLMLDIAAKYIRDNWPGGEIFYDEAECDGYCVADDCESAAESLRREAEKQ